MLPYCNGTELTVDSPHRDQGRIFGLLYFTIGCCAIPVSSFVLYVFSQPGASQSSCYKLLMITTFLDIVNLWNAAIVAGLSSTFGISYCTPGFWWLYPYGHFFMFSWYIYCASSEVLALNRMLVFAQPEWAAFLFRRRRVWLWLIPVFCYAVVGIFVVDPSMFFVLLPNRGFYMDGKMSVFHIFNNFFKFGFVSICYLTMVGFIVRLRRNNGDNSRVTSQQITLSLQTLGVAILADLTTCGYLAASYFPEEWTISQFSGNIGELEWISLHTGTGLIYLFVNKSVRARLCKLFGLNVVGIATTGFVPTAISKTMHQPERS
ncbi:hypothetical protein QR680_006828 [Steinernema hermaphroditum]|uniref:Serpentine receptor class gamma n=1 Tax=Steinernema hermaphroditum TaxID=289476 RepID=A0AA39HZ00_9BILA|nr:hypothetical protein QR680_006828 [Steinernema hermaphroditum]